MTITKSGELASFYTVNKAPIKHLRVYFSPKQAGSGDPSPSNVREISGWDEIKYANLTDLNIAYVRDNLSGGQGINYICNTTFYPHNIKIIGTATANSATPFMRCDNAIKNKTYYIYNLPILDYNAWLCGIGTNISQVRADPNVLTAMGINGYPIVASSSGQMRIYFQASSGKTYNLDFYPIISQNAPIKIDWQSMANILYGGYLDLETGELWKTWEYSQITSSYLNNVPEEYIGINSNLTAFGGGRGLFIRNWEYQNMPGIKYGGIKCACNLYPVTINNKDIYASQYRTYFKIGEEITSVNDFINIVQNLENNNSGLYVAYELAEPQLVTTLTPTQLQTSVGQNVIWSNADRVEVEYDLAESNDELYRRRNILLRSAPHIVMPEPSTLQHFNTNIAAPLKECKIHFNPIQEGSGDPSPNNVREISGWSNIKLQHVTNVVPITFINFNNISVTNGTAVLNPDKSITIIGNGEGGCTLIGEIEPILFNSSIDTLFLSSSIKDLTINKCAIRFLDNNDNVLIDFRPASSYADDAIATMTISNEFTSSKIKITIVRSIPSITIKPFLGHGNNHITYPLNWFSIAGTLYGGYVDLTKGELVKTMETVLLNNPSLWKQYDSTRVYGYTGAIAPNRLTGTSYNIISNIAPSTLEDTWKIKWTSTTSNYCGIYWGTDEPLCTLEELKTLSENNQIQACYALKTPVTYSLSPQSITALRGTNNIWSNANGPIELSYWTH